MTPSNSSSFKHDYAVLLTCRGSSRDDRVMRGWYFLNFQNQTKPVLNSRYFLELSKQLFKFSWEIGASSKNPPLIKCVSTWEGPKEVLLKVLDLSVGKNEYIQIIRMKVSWVVSLSQRNICHFQRRNWICDFYHLLFQMLSKRSRDSRSLLVLLSSRITML